MQYLLHKYKVNRKLTNKQLINGIFYMYRLIISDIIVNHEYGVMATDSILSTLKGAFFYGI